MRSALDQRGKAWTVEALRALHDGQREMLELLCDHPGCGCAVRFVRRYLKNRTNRIEPTDVAAYIGPPSDSAHVTGCRYDAPGRLKGILKQSDPDFVKALDTGKRERRLLVQQYFRMDRGRGESRGLLTV
ncbi:hypothetical protein [Burkholderia multivorans]|uniref:hypothetical protein n=1 Tax=Burkholderia multivorans TaxID=87883 RepID=UPI000A7E7A0F|nr:hypothetical protein [Burkholderia multivorans]